MALKIYCDGGYYKKLKVIVAAVLITNEYEDELMQASEIICISPQKKYYNSIYAELNAIILALKKIGEIGGIEQEIEVLSDCLNIVECIKNNIIIKDEVLNLLKQNAANMLSELDKAKIMWIPRNDNKIAHGLCKEAVKDFKVKNKSRRGDSMER